MINKVSTKSVDTTLHEMWYNKKLILSHMKVWGCPVYVKRITLDKLESKSNKCIFMGYSKELLRYYFQNLLKQKVFVSKHAIFLEKQYLLKESNGSRIELSEV